MIIIDKYLKAQNKIRGFEKGPAAARQADKLSLPDRIWNFASKGWIWPTPAILVYIWILATSKTIWEVQTFWTMRCRRGSIGRMVTDVPVPYETLYLVAALAIYWITFWMGHSEKLEERLVMILGRILVLVFLYAEIYKMVRLYG